MKKIFIALIFFISTNSFAQIELVKDTTAVIPGIYNLQPLPFISSNPAFGVMFGLSLSSNFRFTSEQETKISTANLTTTYTTLKQLMFNFKSNVFTPGDNWSLIGDWRFYITSQPTYGLGTGSSKDAENTLWNEEQPMEFNLIRIHELASTQIFNNVFAGFGIYYDRYTSINDQALNLEEGIKTSHYLYNSQYGFNLENTQSLAFALSMSYDSRDLPTNPSKGHYANLTYKFYSDFLGNRFTSGNISMDFREFVPLSKENKNVLAFWFLGSFMTHGRLPYMNLSALGWDQKGTSGRGYKQGRYRGEDYMYAEAEFRLNLPIQKKHPDRWGVVFFGNVSTTSSDMDDIRLFEGYAPGYGAGLRLMLKEITRSNLTIDYGRGINGQGGVYINYNEFF
ncbi:MAG: BamA/TamA family outer membrane protein [Flavobacteriaceae bacterium]